MGGNRGFRRRAKRESSLSDLEMKTLMLMQIHFAGIRDVDLYSCEKCADFVSGVCQGGGFTGEECMECMFHQAASGNVEMGGNI